MAIKSTEVLADEDVQRGLSYVVKDGLASQAMLTLTGGVFLVAFALKLGASNLVIGLLAAIPPLAQLIQIPGIYLIEKYRTRRLISVYTSMASRSMWLLAALIPFLFSLEAGLSFLVLFLALYSAFGAVSACSWNSWMRDLIPQNRLGSFFSRRMKLATIFGIPVSLAAGYFIDYWKRSFAASELYAFSVLFGLGFLAGMVGVYFISRIPESRMIPSRETGFRKMFLMPFRDSNFKNLLMFSGSWSFAANLAAPFFTVYMLKRLQLDMSLIIVLAVLSQLTSYAFLRIWGGFSDRFSNKSVLAVSGPLFMFSILAWTFTTLPEKHALTIPLLVVIHVAMGISIAGVTLASGNIGLKLAPKGQATSYLAVNSIVNSLAAGIAPILGGHFADFFAQRELSLLLRWASPVREFAVQTVNLQQWDFFFITAFIIGLYSMHRLAMVKEVGEVEEKIVVTELISEVGREMRNLSSAAALMHMLSFPFSILPRMRKK